MMKTTIIFKALAFGLLSYAWASGAAAATNCPAWNTAMVDATYMAIDLSGVPLFLVEAEDDPSTGTIRCFISTDDQSGTLEIDVGVDEDGTLLEGSSPGATLRTKVGPNANGPALTTAELHACRAEVLQSFPWTQHCAQAVE